MLNKLLEEISPDANFKKELSYKLLLICVNNKISFTPEDIFTGQFSYFTDPVEIILSIFIEKIYFSKLKYVYDSPDIFVIGLENGDIYERRKK